MGFPHDKTTHHFRLYADGGAIVVTANDSKDSTNTQAMQSHLKHIAGMFSEGNFSIPMFVHDQVPPGVPVMKEKTVRFPTPMKSCHLGRECESRLVMLTPSKPCMALCVSRLKITRPAIRKIFNRLVGGAHWLLMI